MIKTRNLVTFSNFIVKYNFNNNILKSQSLFIHNNNSLRLFSTNKSTKPITTKNNNNNNNNSNNNNNTKNNNNNSNNNDNDNSKSEESEEAKIAETLIQKKKMNRSYESMFSNKLHGRSIRPKESLKVIENYLALPENQNQNPFNLIFLDSTFYISLQQIPLKIMDYFRNDKPLNKKKVKQTMKENFIKLLSAIQNDDIDTINSFKYDDSHFILETIRDLFYTFKVHSKIDFSNTIYSSIEPIIYKLKNVGQYFDAIVAYYLEISVPQADGSSKNEKYVVYVLWRGTFDEVNESEKELLKDPSKINFESKLNWKVGKFYVPQAITEINDMRYKEILTELLKEINSKKVE